MKKVLLVVIDALGSRVVRPALEAGRLPNLSALIEAGGVDWNSTAIFPSITPPATASLVTGGYPCETGISGAYYYDSKDNRIRYLGNDIWPILREGFGTFFKDFLIRFNEEQLRAETLYDAVKSAGGSAACLNYLWFRGGNAYEAKAPWLFRIWPGVPSSVPVHGPEMLSLGDFVSDSTVSGGEELESSGGIKHRFGFDDQSTAEVLLRLAEAGSLPNLTVAYFPDNDFESHSEGPAQAVSTVEKVDRVLGELFAVSGGLERLLGEVTILVTGDHSQSDLPLDKSKTAVLLDELLEDFQLAPAGEVWSEGDDLMACPNMRAAQFYVQPHCWPRRRELIKALLHDPRIDQLIWREGTKENPRYHVATLDRGELEFWVAEEAAENTARDEYGAPWAWRGELECVDARTEDKGEVRFGTYPNAFERIATAFDEHVSGDFWLTCRVGHEFRLSGTTVHPQGSHGSLHQFDSLSPLIIAGPEKTWPLRQTARSVDVAAICRSILGLPPLRQPGESHVTALRKTR